MKIVIINVFLWFLILGSGNLVAQELVVKDGVFYKNDMLYSGFHKEYYPDGSLKSEINIKNGLEHGEVITYFENGQKHELRVYVDGKKDGTWINWNEKGTKIAEANYSLDLKDGSWFVWDDDGNLLYEMYYKDGKKTGTWKMYGPDGNIKNERKY